MVQMPNRRRSVLAAAILVLGLFALVVVAASAVGLLVLTLVVGVGLVVFALVVAAGLTILALLVGVVVVVPVFGFGALGLRRLRRLGLHDLGLVRLVGVVLNLSRVIVGLVAPPRKMDADD